MSKNIYMLQLGFIISTVFLCGCLTSMESTGRELDASPAETDRARPSGSLKVIAYNVAIGWYSTPEQMATLLEKGNWDIILFNEVPRPLPGKDVKEWTRIVAEKLGYAYYWRGDKSSANHKAQTPPSSWGEGNVKWVDKIRKYEGKYKAIISRTPLKNMKDIRIEGPGWARQMASTVRAETVLNGKPFAIYSIHIPGVADTQEALASSAAKHFADIILSKEGLPNIIIGGDFNNSQSNSAHKYLKNTANIKLASDFFPQKHKSIDHIFFRSASLRVTGGGLVRVEPRRSDHPYVWAEFQIR